MMPARVPSALEIAGLVACAAPFVISFSSSSSQTVNGVVTAFEYRDPIAIAGGIVGGACGLVSLATSLKKTAPSQRAIRVVLCLALVGLGVFQTLRGFGVVGVDKPVVSERMPIAMPHEAPPEKPATKLDDAEPLAQRLVGLWRDSKMTELFDLAQDQSGDSFDRFDLQFIRDTFEESFGKLQRAGELATTTEGDLIRVEGPLVYEKTALTMKLVLVRVGGELRWRGLDLVIPPEHRREPSDADAMALARAILDDVLANKLRPEVFHPRLNDRTPPDIAEKIEPALAGLGPVKSIGKPQARATCEVTRCYAFEVVAKKKKATFTVDLLYSAHAWRVTAWNLAPN